MFLMNVKYFENTFIRTIDKVVETPTEIIILGQNRHLLGSHGWLKNLGKIKTKC